MTIYGYLKEQKFLSHYRTREIEQLQRVIERRRSLLVAGLSGMGKSNLIRFLVSHPERFDDHTALVYVDGNAISAGVTPELYAEIIDQLSQAAGIKIPLDILADDWQLKRILKQSVKEVVGQGKSLVFVLDRFDNFLPDKDELYDYLRSLRDMAGGNMSYILSARNFPPRNSFSELSELFEPKPLWVGPLSERDAFDSIRRDAERLGYIFGKAQKTMLYQLTGGHPGLLKNSCELAAVNEMALNEPPKQIIPQLLQHSGIRDECDELWQSLDEIEREALTFAQFSPGALPDEQKQSLLDKHILVAAKDHKLRFFSPIFEQSLRTFIKISSSSAEIQIAIWGGKVAIEGRDVSLTKQEFRLFELLFKKRGDVVSYDELTSHLWPEDPEDIEDTRSGNINSLKFSLERKLKRVQDSPEYIRTHPKWGYELLQRIAKPGG